MALTSNGYGYAARDALAVAMKRPRFVRHFKNFKTSMPPAHLVHSPSNLSVATVEGNLVTVFASIRRPLYSKRINQVAFESGRAPLSPLPSKAVVAAGIVVR